MVYQHGKKGSHVGSFAGGFINGLLQVLKYDMMAKHYAAWDKFMAAKMDGITQNKLRNQNDIDRGGRDYDERLRKIREGGDASTVGGGGGPAPNASDFDKFKHALIGEEGAGYNTVNSIGATGHYQVMPKNIGPWTEQYLGKRMTQDEFRNDPAAQDKVFEGRTMDVYKQYGNWRDVASIWHSGVPYAQAVAENRHDSNETTAAYVDHVMGKSGLPMTFAKAPGDTATTADRKQDQVQPTVAGGKQDPYALIPDVDDQNRPGQKAKFAQWNNDPIGNSDKILGSVHPDLQAIVKRAQADNPDLHFVAALGKSTAAQQDQAKGWGWSQIGGETQTPHMKGEAVDLWPVNDKGQVVFDKGQQTKIYDAMSKASKELNLNLRWGGLKGEGGANKNFRDAPNFQILNPRPLNQVSKPLSTPTLAHPADQVRQPSIRTPLPPPPPPPPVVKTPAPDVGPSVGEAQPIAPAIPPSAQAAAAPAPSDAEANRPIQIASAETASGYGPEDKWGPTPERKQPDDITLASNDQTASSPQMPLPDMGMPPSPDMSDMGTMAARRGGRVQRFQDGGGVQDPGGSAMGMPPALAGGGQQQVPPIYFNPATYAPAGAPVGKGISATSAPTFTAGAIPTLPMQRGGAVKKYQDGGDVGDDMASTNYEDQQLMSMVDEGGAPAASDPLADIKLDDRPAVPAPTSGQPPIATQADMSPIPSQRAPLSDAETGRPIQLASSRGFQLPPVSIGGMGRMGGGMRMPGIGSGGGGAKDTGLGVDTWNESHPNHPDNPANHPDLPPNTPQISDQNGNPSNGLVRAISDGLHEFGEMLGIVPGKHVAIAGDPATQANRRGFASGQGVPGLPEYGDKEDKQADQTIDPHQILSDNLRNIAKLEALHDGLMSRGDPQGAAKVAASIMYRSAQVSMKFGRDAVEAFYKNDLHGAVNNLKIAHDAIADGTLVNAKIIKDPNEPGGEAVEVSGHKLNGDQLWSQVVGPRAVLTAATNAANGSTAWKMYEESAGRFNPNFQAEMQERRLAASQQRAEEKEATKKTAADEEANREAEFYQSMQQPAGGAIAPGPALVTPAESPGGPTAPAAPATAISPTPAVAPGETLAPTKSADTTGTAAPQAPPPTADTRLGIAPGPGVQQAGAAEPQISLEEQQVENTRQAGLRRVWDEHNFDGYKGVFKDASSPPRPPQTIPGYERLTPQGKLGAQKLFQDQVANWKQENKGRMDAMNKEIDKVNADYSTQFAAVKQRQSALDVTTRQAQLQQSGEELKEKRGLEAPMVPKEEEERFKETPTTDVLAGTAHVDYTPTGNVTADAQARRNKLGDMFDLPDETGKRQGGQQRIAQLGNTVWNIQGVNKRASKEQIGDVIMGLAKGAYSFDEAGGKTIKRGGEDVIPLTVLYGKKPGLGQKGPPSATVYMPPSDWEVIKSIRQEMMDYASRPPPPTFPGYKGAIPPPGHESLIPPMQTPWGGT